MTPSLLKLDWHAIELDIIAVNRVPDEQECRAIFMLMTYFLNVSCFRRFVVVFLVPTVFFFHHLDAADEVLPLRQAHAHNDYLHTRPLLDAIDHGFNSVEADIFLIDGKLLVAHSILELKPDRTLKALYLEPLRERIKAHGGNVIRGGGSFSLLIDIKSDAESTYLELHKVLAEFNDIVSVVRENRRESKAVDVVISGNRPIAFMQKQALRYAGIDGRFGDLDSNVSPDLFPLISDQWGKHFKWQGEGKMSEADQKKLDDAVGKAHAHGRKIRFWATPDNPRMWELLRASGVDMINTDDLAGLEKFLRGQSLASP